MSDLLPLEEAQARLLALGDPVAIETLPIEDAAGRWASRDVVASRAQPPRDLSTMDGYAIRFADLPGPWRCIGESSAGTGFVGAVAAGEAVRIFTGAPVPDGADTVLVQEDVERVGDEVRLTGNGPPTVGSYIRRAAADFEEGATLIRAGDALTPARIALVAMGGHGLIATRRRVTVALISTGSELVPATTLAQGDQIPAANGPMLRAILCRLPVTTSDLGIVEDDESALLRALADAAYADIIVTIGGASVGDHDLVRPALAKAGATLDFWRVAVKPGKPLLAGKLDDAIVLGLPGNPVSAFVTAKLFLEPLIRRLCGARDPLPKLIVAPLAHDLAANGERAEFLRGRWRNGAAEALDEQASAAVAALAAAEFLIHRPVGAPSAIAGENAQLLLLT